MKKYNLDEVTVIPQVHAGFGIGLFLIRMI